MRTSGTPQFTSADTGKMDYGPVLVIAGAANYFWAPYASAYSFLKAGGGYVHLACPKSMTKSIANRGREIVFQPQAETTSGSIAYANKNWALKKWTPKGKGLGGVSWTGTFSRSTNWGKN